MNDAIEPHQRVVAQRFERAPAVLIQCGEDVGPLLKRARQEPDAQPVRAVSFARSDWAVLQGRLASLVTITAVMHTNKR